MSNLLPFKPSPDTGSGRPPSLSRSGRPGPAVEFFFRDVSNVTGTSGSVRFRRWDSSPPFRHALLSLVLPMFSFSRFKKWQPGSTNPKLKVLVLGSALLRSAATPCWFCLGVLFGSTLFYFFRKSLVPGNARLETAIAPTSTVAVSNHSSAEVFPLENHLVSPRKGFAVPQNVRDISV